jgi:hypothetical protein
MKNVIVTLSLAGALIVASAPLHAQTAPAAGGQKQMTQQQALDNEIQLLRQDVKSARKQIVAANLPLTEDEAVKFWPIYEKYTAEGTKINDKLVALIKDYAENFQAMTPEKASALIRGVSEVDKAMVDLRASYIPEFEKVVPATKAATFFQIDRRLQLLVDLQLASQIPLALR